MNDVTLSSLNPTTGSNTEIPGQAVINNNNNVEITPIPSLIASPELTRSFTDHDVARAHSLDHKLISEDGIPLFATDTVPCLPPVPLEVQASFFVWLNQPRTFSYRLGPNFEVKMTLSLWHMIECLNVARENVLGTPRESNRWVGSSLIYELGEVYMKHVLTERDVPEDVIETILQAGVRRRLEIDPMDRDLRVYASGASEQQLAEIIGSFEHYLTQLLPERLQWVNPEDKELLEILSQVLPPYIQPPYTERHLQLWLVRKICFKYSLPDNQNGSLLQSMSLADHTIQKDGQDIKIPGGTIDLSCAAKVVIPNGFEADELYCPFELTRRKVLQPCGGELFKGWQWMMNYISNTRQVADPLKIPHNYRSFLKRLVHYLKGARGLVQGDEKFLASKLTDYEGLDVAVTKGLRKHLPETLASCIALTFQGCLLLRQANPNTDLTDTWKVDQKQFALLKASTNPMFWKNAEHPLLSLLGLGLSVHGLPFEAVAAAVELFALIAVCTKPKGTCNDKTQVLLTKHEKALALQIKVSTPSQAYHLLLPFNPRTLLTRLQPLMDTQAGRGFLQGLSRTGLPIGSLENDTAGPVHHYLEKKGVSPYIFQTQALELLQQDAKGSNFSLTLGLYSIWQAFHPNASIAPALLNKIPALLELTKEKNGRLALLKQIGSFLPKGSQTIIETSLEQLSSYPEALVVWIEVLALSGKADLVAHARQFYRQTERAKVLSSQLLQQATIAIITGLQTFDIPAAAELLWECCRKSNDGKNNLWRCCQTLIKATQAAHSAQQTLALASLWNTTQNLIDTPKLEVAAEDAAPLAWLAEQLIAENQFLSAKNILERLATRPEWKANCTHVVNSWVKICSWLASQESQDRFSNALTFYKKGLDGGIPLENADASDLKDLAQIISQYSFYGAALSQPCLDTLQQIHSLVDANADSRDAMTTSYQKTISKQIANQKAEGLRAGLAHCRSKLSEPVLIKLLPQAIGLLLDSGLIHDAEAVLQWLLELPEQDELKSVWIQKLALSLALDKPLDALKFLKSKPITARYKGNSDEYLEIFLIIASNGKWTMNQADDLGRALVRSLTKDDGKLAIKDLTQAYKAIVQIADQFVPAPGTANAIVTRCKGLLSEILQRALQEGQYTFVEEILLLMHDNGVASTTQATTCQDMLKAICGAKFDQATSLLAAINKCHDTVLGAVRTHYRKALAHVSNAYVRAGKHEDAFVLLEADSALKGNGPLEEISEAAVNCAEGFLGHDHLDRCLAALEFSNVKAHNTPKSQAVRRGLALKLLEQKEWHTLASLLQTYKTVFEKCDDASFNTCQCASQTIEGLLSAQPTGESLRSIMLLSREWPTLTAAQWVKYCELCNQAGEKQLLDKAWNSCIPKAMYSTIFETFLHGFDAAEIGEALKLLALLRQCLQLVPNEYETFYLQAIASIASKYLRNGQTKEAFNLLSHESSQSKNGLHSLLLPVASECAKQSLIKGQVVRCLSVLELIKDDTKLSPELRSVWADLTLQLWKGKKWLPMAILLQKHAGLLQQFTNDGFDATIYASDTIDGLLAAKRPLDIHLRLVTQIAKKWPFQPSQCTKFLLLCVNHQETLTADEIWNAFITTESADLACFYAMVDLALVKSETTILEHLLANPALFIEGLMSFSISLEGITLLKKLLIHTLSRINSPTEENLLRSSMEFIEHITKLLDKPEFRETKTSIVLAFAAAAWISDKSDLVTFGSKHFVDALPQCSWETHSRELVIAIEGLMEYAKRTEDVESVLKVCTAIPEHLLPNELTMALAASLMQHPEHPLTEEAKTFVTRAMNNTEANVSPECSKNFEDILNTMAKATEADLNFIQRCFTSEKAQFFDPLAIVRVKDQWFVARIGAAVPDAELDYHGFLVEYINALPSLCGLIERKELHSFKKVLGLIIEISEDVPKANHLYLKPLFRSLPKGYLRISDNKKGCNFNPPEDPTFVLEWIKLALLRHWKDVEAAAQTYAEIFYKLDALANSRLKDDPRFQSSFAETVATFVALHTRKPAWLDAKIGEKNAISTFNKWRSILSPDDIIGYQLAISALRNEIPEDKWNRDMVRIITMIFAQSSKCGNAHIINNIIGIIQTYVEKAPMEDLEAIIPAFRQLTTIVQNNLLVPAGVLHPFDGLRKVIGIAIKRNVPDLARTLTELTLDAVLFAKPAKDEFLATYVIRILQIQGNHILSDAASLHTYAGYEKQFYDRMDSMLPINRKAMQQLGTLEDSKNLLDALLYNYQVQSSNGQGDECLKWSHAFLDKWLDALQIDGREHIESLFNACGLIREVQKHFFAAKWKGSSKLLEFSAKLKPQFKNQMKSTLNIDPALFQRNEEGLLQRDNMVKVYNQLTRAGLLIKHAYWNNLFQDVGIDDGKQALSEWMDVIEKFFQKWKVPAKDLDTLSKCIQNPLAMWHSAIPKEQVKIQDIRLKLIMRWLQLIHGLAKRNHDQSYGPTIDFWHTVAGIKGV